MKRKIKVSIVGGSGYAGGELLRILLGHPFVDVDQVTSRRYDGMSVSLVHPNLREGTNIIFTNPQNLKECDLIFLALPNGESMKIMTKIMKISPKIIDCGADFRLNQEENWESWYKAKHESPHLLKKFVYGLPELNRDKIEKANYVSIPGCEACISILTLYPLVKENLINLDRIYIDAKMPSSASGAQATKSSHHPERSRSVRSYKPTNHRHTAEVVQELTFKNKKPNIYISATAIEMVRGILVTIQTILKRGVVEKDIWKAYKMHYKKEPFIRIVKEKRGLYRYPEPKILQGTNFADIGFEKEQGTNRIVLIGAIDNLVKGTAGNAVQCMNIMYKFPETSSLAFIGLHPV